MSHASRRLSRERTANKGPQVVPAHKFIRKGHVILNTNDETVFTGQSKLLDGSTIPSISAAKRYVRTVLRPKYGEVQRDCSPSA